jgi:hypothetical protein
MNKNRFYTGKGGKMAFFLIIPVVIALAGLAVMWLWNAILPELLGVNTITFWQSVGLFVLCKILFGNYRGRGQHAGSRSFGAGRMIEKWKNATPEEREALREEWRNRCKKPN